MCGLSGEINFDGRPADADAVQRMTDALSPRGPDGLGIVVRGPVGLGPVSYTHLTLPTNREV